MTNKLVDALPKLRDNESSAPYRTFDIYYKLRADAWEAIARRAVGELSSIASDIEADAFARSCAHGALLDIGGLPPASGADSASGSAKL